MSAPRKVRSTAHEGAASVVDKAGEPLPAETPDPDVPPIAVARRRKLTGWMGWVVWISVWLTASMAAMLFVEAFEHLLFGEDPECQ